MATFELSSPDGGKYQVEADTVEQAVKDLHGYRQQQTSQAMADEGNKAPELVKRLWIRCRRDLYHAE